MIVFLAAAAALYGRGHVLLGESFAIVAVPSSLVVYALPQ